MNYREKNTKIIATISDLRCEPEFIQDLFDHGMNVARLNTAHQDREGTIKAIENIRSVSDKIAIVIDTKGPEIRIRGVEEAIPVTKGDEIIIVKQHGGMSTKEGLQMSYDGVVEEVPVGNTILIDDGYLQLTVKEKRADSLVCVADNTNAIKRNKSVNIPGVHINLPSITAKDEEFIKLAAEMDVDFVAHSFVRNKADVIAVQELLDKEGKGDIKIIAKVENREGVDNLNDILDAAYAVMVARGDLGIEVPASEVPLMQKEMIQTCVRRSKPVIVATQMLESMIKNPRPTRAEVNDIANAILDGTSAVMLSGETSMGDYPVEAVRTMSEVAQMLCKSEHRGSVQLYEKEEKTIPAILGKAAVHAALQLKAKAFVVPTHSGKTARFISSFRSRIPVFAQCYNKKVMRQLAMSYGVRPRGAEEYKTTDEMVQKTLSKLIEERNLNEDDVIVFIGGTPGSVDKKPNFIEIETVRNIMNNH